mmetsp:Transcript_88798/g.237603  ORF Transcript_88798/g.237603 Transcript_88798/m.237603 type:complete len:456 (+) Transcript_88798:876-2243(+)
MPQSHHAQEDSPASAVHLRCSPSIDDKMPALDDSSHAIPFGSVVTGFLTDKWLFLPRRGFLPTMIGARRVLFPAAESAGERQAVTALTPQCAVNAEVQCDFCGALVETDEPCCALCGSPAIHTRIRTLLDSHVDDSIVREATGLVEDALLELNSVRALRNSHADKVSQVTAEMSSARTTETELQGTARKLRDRLEVLEDAESTAAIVGRIQNADAQCSELHRASQHLLAGLKKSAGRLLKRERSTVGSTEMLAAQLDDLEQERASVSERLSAAECRVAVLTVEAAEVDERLSFRRTELVELEHSVAGAEEAAAQMRDSGLRVNRVETLLTESSRLQRRNDAARLRCQELEEAGPAAMVDLHNTEQRLMAVKAKSDVVKSEIAALFLEMTDRQREFNEGGSAQDPPPSLAAPAGRPLAGELPSASPVSRSAAAARGVAVFGPPRRRSLDAQSPRPT